MALGLSLALLVGGCHGSHQHRAAATVDGYWRTVGYGTVLAVSHGQLRTFQTTGVSCLPAERLAATGRYGAAGAVGFGTGGAVIETVQRTGSDRGQLRELGTAAPVDLVSIPRLPARCGQRSAGDPVHTFEVFLATFAENYNSTAGKHIDWAAVRRRYRPLVTDRTTPARLFHLLSDVVRPLGDDHVEINGPYGAHFSGLRPGTRDDVEADVPAALDTHLRRDLGVGRIRTWAGGAIAYADLPDGRGYLRLTAFDDWHTHPDSYPARRALLDKVADAVFTAHRIAAWKGLVIDVSYNSGGDDQLGLDLAGRLTDRPYLAYTKRARIDPDDPTRYGPKRRIDVVPTPGRPHYTGPIRLLISDLSISAAETFTEAMLGRRPAPARVGTTTQGVFSDDHLRRLPNGWTFSLGNENYTAPNGRDYEGRGIPPTVRVPSLTARQLASHQDPALDRP